MNVPQGVKLFRKENLHSMPEDLIYLFNPGEIRRMNAEKDRLLLECLARYSPGTRRRAALLCLGIPEAPSSPFRSSSDEKYRILEEQIQRLEDMASFSLLKDASMDSRCAASAFAFCRLTGTGLDFTGGPYSGYSFRCGLFPGMKKPDVLDFCMEMTSANGPFAAEAEKLLRSIRNETCHKESSK